jgi:hypothetical protein
MQASPSIQYLGGDQPFAIRLNWATLFNDFKFVQIEPGRNANLKDHIAASSDTVARVQRSVTHAHAKRNV